MDPFTILSVPVRRRLLGMLVSGEKSSGELTQGVQEEFEISQSGVSQHLKTLRENGFAKVRSEGTKRMYSLSQEGFDDVEKWLTPFREFWEPKLDALALEIERGKKKR